MSNAYPVRRARRRGVVALSVFLLAALAGCDSLLEVELPGKVPAELLDDPGLAETIVASVASDFECAYNNYTFGTAVHSDQMWHSSGNLIMRNWGQRRVTSDFPNYVTGSCDGWAYGMWVPLHTARVQAEQGYDLISSFPDEEVPGKTGLLAEAATFAGFSYTLLGEGFCQMTLDGGPPQSPGSVLAVAEEWFTTALQHAEAAGDAATADAARVGRARVRLDLGDWSGAAADAAQVPEGFEFVATRSGDSERRQNKGNRFFDVGGHATVAPEWRDVTFRGVDDPRLTVVDAGRLGFDAVTPLWLSTKWPDLSTGIPVATWEEAQLILAEASLMEGDEAEAVAAINRLHDAVGLPAYDPAFDGPVLDQILYERGVELFQEGGHRLNDMLRHDIPFPTGTDHVGQQYGNTTCLPVPNVEVG